MKQMDDVAVADSVLAPAAAVERGSEDRASEAGGTESSCANCGVAMQGRFCHACGQKRTSLRPTLHDFVHDAFHEFAHVDGKIFRTMKLLIFSPGALTREFNDGRRVRFVSPLRLYLIWSVIFFALFTFVANRGEGLRVTYNPTNERVETRSEFERRIERGVVKAQQDPRRFGAALVGALPKAMFLLMPLFAALSLLFFRKREPRFIPHLYASIHLHAFIFFIFTVAVLLQLPRIFLPLGLVGQRVIGIITALALLAPVPYYFLALRRIHAERWRTTVGRGVLLGVSYNIFLFVTMMAVVIYTVMLL